MYICLSDNPVRVLCTVTKKTLIIINRRGYQSITQQYLKKIFNKGLSKLHVSA